MRTTAVIMAILIAAYFLNLVISSIDRALVMPLRIATATSLSAPVRWSGCRACST